MAANIDPVPLIVIVGETASGKTAAGIQLAKQIDGEIICADSRTIYKGMDIGTATPSYEEQSGVVHHLLNILEPNERYSAAQFQKDAQLLIDDIWKRGKFPIIVGGTGLYIDSVLFDYSFKDAAAIDPDNPRHKKQSSSKDRMTMRHNTEAYGLRLDRETLNKRIADRVNTMFEQGFLQEVARVSRVYGWEHEAMSGIGYRVARTYFEGEATESQVKDAFIARDMSLAKRQRTWFKRNPHIKWFNNDSQLVATGSQFAARFKV